MPSGAPVVAVVGAGEPDAGLDAVAEEIGAGLARSGATIVCGGLGGVMVAACRGAKAAGGTTVGILPGGDRRAGNPHLDVVVPTGMGEARNVLVVRASDAVVAVGGEYGTLSEIAFALKLRIPVVGVRTWQLVKEGVARRDLHVADDAPTAVEAAMRLSAPAGRA